MNKASISIIVPIYGVAQYIGCCARSLFEQTMANLEFIFVDDCTPDNSIEILKSVIEEYPERASQTRILKHEVNMGLPIARQTGLAAAGGEFVFHCDSDDFVEKDICEKLFTKALETESDMVVCDFIREYPDHRVYTSGRGPEDKIALINSMLYMKTSWTLCDRLVKRSLYNDKFVRPKIGMNMAEDMLLSIQLVYYSKRISYVEQALYHYFVRESSMANNLIKDRIFPRFRQAICNTDMLIGFLVSKGLSTDVQKALDYTKFNQKQLLMPLVGDKHFYSIWRNTYPELNSKVWRMKFKFKEKCKFYLVLTHIYKPSLD